MISYLITFDHSIEALNHADEVVFHDFTSFHILTCHLSPPGMTQLLCALDLHSCLSVVETAISRITSNQMSCDTFPILNMLDAKGPETIKGV